MRAVFGVADHDDGDYEDLELHELEAAIKLFNERSAESPRPRGRAPTNKVWDSQNGVWIDQTETPAPPPAEAIEPVEPAPVVEA